MNITKANEGNEAAAVQTCAPTLPDPVRKFRLAVYCPNAGDGTSLVRALGPLSAMEKEDPRLELRLPVMGGEGRELTWDWLIRCDALLVQRPWLPVQAQLCVQAKLMDLPLWVDWDDDYLTIHPSNPHYHQFAHDQLEETLRQIVRLADVITVTTPELARRLQRLAPPGSPAGKVRVVPNACQWPSLLADQLPPRQRRISWRGGQSHELDLASVLPQLGEIARLPQCSRWQWCFLGDVPWQVKGVLPEDRLLSDFGADPWLYIEALCRLAPYVHLVPLDANRFNPAKSNLAWLEASCAGAVVLAPNWPEWQRPGIVNYETPVEFEHALRRILHNFTEAGPPHPGVEESRRWIAQHLVPAVVNRQRWEILNGFAEGMTQKETEETKKD